MALIAAPAVLTIVKSSALVVPKMLQALVLNALTQAQYLYEHYSPPLVSLAFTCGALTGTNSFECAVEPSADGLSYWYRYAVVRGATSITVGLEVFYDAGAGWISLGAVATTAGTGLYRDTVAGLVIPGTALRLKFTFTKNAGAGTLYTPSHILIWPQPVVTTGIKPSGFRPAHTGLYVEDYIPITTEHVGRPKRNACALQADRKPMVVSFGQVGTGTCQWRYTAAADGWFTLGTVRIRLPDASGAQTLSWHSKSEVTGGSTTAIVWIVPKYKTNKGATVNAISLDGSAAAGGAWDSDTHTVYPESTGLGAYVDCDVMVKSTTGNTTSLRSLCCYWRPTVDPCVTGAAWPAGATPPAAIGLAREMVEAPVRLASTPYAPCVHLADTISSQTTRYVSTVYGPGQRYASVDFYRHWSGAAGALPTNRLTLGTATEKAQAPNLIGYTHVWGGDKAQDMVTSSPKAPPGGAGDHFVALTEDRGPHAPIDMTVEACAGYTLWVAQTTPDLSTL